MSRFLVVTFGFVSLLFAGCATQSDDGPPREWAAPGFESSPKPAPVLRQTNRPVAAPVAVVPVVIPARTSAPPAVVRNQPPPQVSRPAPILTWTSLDRWAIENHLAAPRKVSSSPVASYAVNSAQGTLTLVIGSTEAVWRGMQINLGFAPEIADDQIFVHGLDLQKTMEPLLLGQSLVLGPSRIIVLDPGHGGVNAGTHSLVNGRNEKEFTLDWARRLKPLLETNGWKVFLTRTNDTDIALSNRVAFAEACHADVFLSLHFNSAAPDRTQCGLETYLLTPTGMPSTLTRGYSDVWADRYPNNAFDLQNLLLAVRLHAALLAATGEEDRGVRHARFMGVLQGQRRPAVLIEGGYLSNTRESDKIESAEFRQKLAEAVAGVLH